MTQPALWFGAILVAGLLSGCATARETYASNVIYTLPWMSHTGEGAELVNPTDIAAYRAPETEVADTTP